MVPQRARAGAGHRAVRRMCAAIRSRPISMRDWRPTAAGDHDGVIAFGGGSALDAGKVIAFMSGQTRPMWDFEDIGDWWTRADPARHRTDRRRADHGRHRLRGRPRRRGHQRGDPSEEDHLPPADDAGGGHQRSGADRRPAARRSPRPPASMRSCTASRPTVRPGFHPLADGIALEGMRLIQTYLPRACDNGTRHRGALAHAGGGQHGRDRVPEGARAACMPSRIRSAPSSIPITA